MSPPLYAYYGDDFTGSTDVLEQLAGAGLPTVLFLGPPTPQQLARFSGCQAFGIAGDSRSRPPEWMNEHLPGIFAQMKALGAPVNHYKVCSTFDSAPGQGSIGRAMEIGRSAFAPDILPIVVGAPHLRRYVAFGNLFAAAGGEPVFRIDRHPTMSRHPVTPMLEADLRTHLAAQTSLPIALINLPTLRSGRAPEALRVLLEDGSAILFDGVDDDDLAETGRLIWNRATQRTVFAVGSSGLTTGLIEAWGAQHKLKPSPMTTAHAAADALLVVSGSCSPITARQIEWALANGFHGIAVSPENLLDPATGHAARRNGAASASAVLRRGKSVVLYSAIGPLSAGVPAQDGALGAALGEMLADMVRQSGVRRVLVAGGDTSSHAIARLGAHALTFLAPLQPGAPLCRLHADDPDFDGLELVLKGGQIGSADFFEVARGSGHRGRALRTAE